MGEEYRQQDPLETEQTFGSPDDATGTEPAVASNAPKNPVLIFFGVLFLFGLLLGALFIAKADKSILDTLDYLFFTSIKTRTKDTLLPVFAASMTSSFLFILMSYLCGLSMWGRGIIPLVPLLRGFGLGMTAGHIYSYGISGFFYYLLLILPGAFVSVLAILCTAQEGARFSKELNAFHKAKQKPDVFKAPPSIQNYSLRFAILTLVAILAAVLDLLTAFFFSGIFQGIF